MGMWRAYHLEMGPVAFTSDVNCSQFELQWQDSDVDCDIWCCSRDWPTYGGSTWISKTCKGDVFQTEVSPSRISWHFGIVRRWKRRCGDRQRKRSLACCLVSVSTKSVPISKTCTAENKCRWRKTKQLLEPVRCMGTFKGDMFLDFYILSCDLQACSLMWFSVFTYLASYPRQWLQFYMIYDYELFL